MIPRIMMIIMIKFLWNLHALKRVDYNFYVQMTNTIPFFTFLHLSGINYISIRYNVHEVGKQVFYHQIYKFYACYWNTEFIILCNRNLLILVLPYRLQSGYLNHHYMHVNAYTYNGYSFEMWHIQKCRNHPKRDVETGTIFHLLKFYSF